MADFNDLGIIVLAAGKGTRMESELPKVLHRIHAKSMINYVMDAIAPLSGAQICVVVGHQAQAVKNEVSLKFHVNFVLQKRLLGTGDAVKAAIPHLYAMVKNVLVLCGDVPLIRTDTLKTLVDTHKRNHHSVSILTVDMTHPTGYGRIIQDKSGSILRIVEEKDTGEEEKKITKVNSGIYCFEKTALVQSLGRIQADNIQQEFYLTDTIEIIRGLGGKIGYTTVHDAREVIGVNTPDELKKAALLVLSMKNELP